jgi:hypothetical protein
MVDRIARDDDPHSGPGSPPRPRPRPRPSRLEGWLEGTIRAGGLRALPGYRPTGWRGEGEQCPERYARALLARLRTAREDRWQFERLKDDGRAFRSWVESAPSPARTGAAFESGIVDFFP